MTESQADPGIDSGSSSREQPSAALNKLFYEGYMVSRAIYVAAQLGVADTLKDQPLDIKEIAQAVGADSDALYRMLRALASVGVFTEVKPYQFGSTPLANCLRADAQGSLRDYILLYGSDLSRRPMDNLLYSVRTGMPAVEQVFGMSEFAYVDQHPEVSSMFEAGLASIASLDISDVLANYDFSSTPLLRTLEVETAPLSPQSSEPTRPCKECSSNVPR